MTTFAQQEVARLRPYVEKLEADQQELMRMRERMKRFEERIRSAIVYAENEIDGAEESRARDSILSTIIGILEGSLNSDGVPR